MQDWTSKESHKDMPAAADVLCGKKATSKHPGNIFYRQLILAKVDDYLQSTTNAQKGLISETILKVLHKSGARFMKLDKKTNSTWGAISSAEARREKVSHAMRDQVRDRKGGEVNQVDTCA